MWKGKAKELPYHQIHIRENFPEPPKLLSEENVQAEAESILLGLFEEDIINVVLTEDEDT